MSISEREQGNPHNKIALFETKCNDMLHLTILQYNTRINDICFPKKKLMYILRCHEYLWYICIFVHILIYLIHLNYHPITRWRYFPTWICGNNFPQVEYPPSTTSRSSSMKFSTLSFPPLTFSVPHFWQLSISHFQLIGSVSLNWCPVLTLVPVWVHWDFSALPPPYSSQGVPLLLLTILPLLLLLLLLLPLQPPWSAHPVVDAGLLDAKVLYHHRRPHY